MVHLYLCLRDRCGQKIHKSKKDRRFLLVQFHTACILYSYVFSVYTGQADHSQSQYTSIIFNLTCSISFYSSSINVNLFLSFVNLTSRLSFSIFLLLSLSIPHLSTSIFFYLLANLVDAYLSLLQVLNSLSISPYNKRRSVHY